MTVKMWGGVFIPGVMNSSANSNALNILAQPGGSVFFGITMRNIFRENLTLEFSCGYIPLKVREENNYIRSALKLPVELKSGYRFSVTPWLQINPFIGGGISWDRIRGDFDGVLASEDPVYVTKTGISPLMSLGTHVIYLPWSQVELFLCFDYMVFFEQGNTTDAFLIQAGFGYRL